MRGFEHEISKWLDGRLDALGLLQGSVVKVVPSPPLPVGPDRSQPEEAAIVGELRPHLIHLRLPAGRVPEDRVPTLADALAEELRLDRRLSGLLEGLATVNSVDLDYDEGDGVIVGEVVTHDLGA